MQSPHWFNMIIPLTLLNGSAISPVESCKYLGIMLNQVLKWKAHLKQIQEKATKGLAALTCLTGSTWGADLKGIRLLYQSTILPRILYGCSAWYTPVNKHGHVKGIIKTLSSIQYRATRIITGAFKATFSPALDIEAYILLMQQWLKKAAGDLLLWIISHPIYKDLLSMWNTSFHISMEDD